MSVVGVLAALGSVGRLRAIGVAAVCVTAIAASCALRIAALESSPLRSMADNREVITADASVRADPRRFRPFGSDAALVRVDVTRADSEHATVSGHHPILAIVRDGADDLTVGRRVRLHGRLAPSDRSDIVATLSVDRRSPAGRGPWWWSAADRVRAGVRRAVQPAPPDRRALIPALVDGEDDQISEQVREEFRRAGLTHLLAVSGTNLTIVLVLTVGAARAVGVGRRRLIAVGVLAVIGFVLLARPDPSVLRAAAMGSVGLVAAVVGGRGGLRVLSTAVVTLLFLDPWLSRSAGFTLSVCATAGILAAAGPLAARLSRWMPRWCAVAIAVPLAAQCACLPALVALSGQVSLVGIVANVLVSPLVAPTTVVGLLGGLTDLVSRTAALSVGVVGTWLAAAILAIAHLAAGVAGAVVPWPWPWWLSPIVAPLVLVGFWYVAARPAVVLGLALGLAVALIRPPQAGWPPPGWLMVACDVGQGDATVVNAGSGSAVVVDAGPDPFAVDGCLRRLGIDRIPLAVLTHSHLDHLGGWHGLIRGRTVGTVLHGPSGGPGRSTVAGDRLRVGPIRADVLWPPVGMPAPAAADGTAMNNSSVVLRASLHGVRILLAGDIETEAQEALLASGEPVAAEVLKVAHHGSSRQSAPFIGQVGAMVATISVGAHNDYGHPAPAALRMLRREHTRWVRTDADGDIAVTLRQGRIVVVTHR